MDEQIGKKGMSALSVVLVVVLIALAVGGGTYYYMNTKAEKAKKDLNTQITELQSQIATLKTATTSSSSTSTTADATADWKTYMNTGYGFSVKYPKDWTPTPSTAASSTSCNVICANITFTGSDRFWLQVTDFTKFIASIAAGSFTDQTLKGYVKYTQGVDGTAKTVNGQEMLIISKINPDDATKTYRGAFVLKSNKIYEIQATYATSTATDKEFDDMVSTFQFTK